MAYNFPRREVLLSTQPASSSASISFTSAINSNFSTYLVKIRDMIPQTNATTLQLQYSTDNGVSYINANYSYEVAFSTTTSGNVTASASAAHLILVTVISNSTARGFCGDYMFYGLGQATQAALAGMSVHQGSDNICALILSQGTNSSTTAVNALQFTMTSGNINSGTFYLYGISEP